MLNTNEAVTNFLVRKLYFYAMPDILIQNERFYNPVDYVLQKIGGTWKAPVLWRLRSKSLRYTELEADIPHISQKMLTKTLKELEADGFVTKKIFAKVPPHTEYSLTEKGRKIYALIQEIRKAGIELMREEGIDYETLIKEERSKKSKIVNMQPLIQHFIDGMKATTWLEYVAVFTGIASVWYSKREDILVYPVGLINTIIYIYLSVKGHLFGEASVNFYYTVMSIYGWILWAKKDEKKHHVVVITKSDMKEWTQQLLFFAAFYVAIYFSLSYIKNSFAPGAIPWADAFASATAYTGMWLMAKKKVESWIWWIITDFASVPLYFVKGFVFTSVYYFILLIMAFFGLMEWYKRSKQAA